MTFQYINYINRKLFKFDPEFKKIKNIRRFGTFYGGYDICVKNLLNPIVISCGVGEDVSFDIELIKNFDAKIILVDPTPRAVNYYDALKKNFGIYSRTKYNETGKISVNNYNLRKINAQNLILEKKAIWDKSNIKLNLFFPLNKEHVSLSINKKYLYQEFFSARTITIKEIIKKYSLDRVDILKLDVEGCEINVLNFIIENKIFPKQVIVEYDLKKKPSITSYFKLINIHKKILNNNYFLCSVNKKGDFLYLLND
jgi:FkbM family methyltransferase